MLAKVAMLFMVEDRGPDTRLSSAASGAGDPVKTPRPHEYSRYL